MIYFLDWSAEGWRLWTTIFTTVPTVMAAIGAFIYKCRGRSWREIFKSIVEWQNEDIKELSKTLVEQGKVVGEIINKELEKKQPKPKN